MRIVQEESLFFYSTPARQYVPSGSYAMLETTDVTLTDTWIPCNDLAP